MEKGLVSIITPCYNTGNIVHRLLDSVLEQDYPFVEMYAIDDGSTDNTFEVLNSYKPRFKERNYRFECLRQVNQGQSVAINNALKLVGGEFLTWPDSDDYYKLPNALTTFVQTFREQPDDFGAVRCLPTYVSEDGKSARIMADADMGVEQFENCLYNRKFVWPPGNYMIKMSAFDDCNPQRDIYVEKNAGQNWQMLLPLLYKYKCYTLPVSYFCVLERAVSHSRGQYKGYEQQIQKITAYANTIHHTLERMIMPMEEKKALQRKIIVKYLWERWHCSVCYRRRDEMRIYESELKNVEEKISIKQKVLILLSRHRSIYKIGIRFLRILKLSWL